MLKFKIIFIFLILFIGRSILCLLGEGVVDRASFRDPFSFNGSGQLNMQNSDSSNKIKILAITESNNKNGAILQRDEEQEVVFVGDSIWGYQVKDITLNSVKLLSTDKKIINLLFESRTLNVSFEGEG